MHKTAVVPRRGARLQIYLFLPLFLFIAIYGSLTLGAARRSRELAGFFESLFKGEAPAAGDLKRFRLQSEDKLNAHMEPWPSAKKEAALFLLEWSALYPGARLRLAPADERDGAKKALDLQAVINPPLLRRAAEAVAEGDGARGERLYRDLWMTEPDFFLTPAGRDALLDIRRIVLTTGTWDEWIPLLEEKDGLGSFEGAFFLASCYEKEDDADAALSWYEAALDRSRSESEVRRSQWYVLRLVINEFPRRLSDVLGELGPLDNGGGWFDDLFDDYFSLLIRRGRGRELTGLIRPLHEAGLTEPASQGLFLLKQLQEQGLTLTDRQKTLFDLFDPDPRGYVYFRSYDSLWPLPPAGVSVTEHPAVSSGDPENGKGLYAYLIGAGYREESYALWQRRRDPMSPDAVLALASYLEEEERLYDLIRFAGYWYYRYPAGEAQSLFSYVYPGAERYLLPTEDIPRELILGVIRRESAFSEAIVSRAGAGGLMQLMPSTAAELARKHDFKDWDLSNPVDNIRLGTLYLEWLRERPWSDSWAEVLAAYNGGGGNLRSWKRAYPNEDPELFIQSIPFRETRDYVRKVIVAAAAYRYLDTGTPPGDWTESFYSAF